MMALVRDHRFVNKLGDLVSVVADLGKQSWDAYLNGKAQSSGAERIFLLCNSPQEPSNTT